MKGQSVGTVESNEVSSTCEREFVMVTGIPAYSTLMELRTAGWTLTEIAQTYGVSENSIRAAMAAHFMWRMPGDSVQAVAKAPR